MPVTNEAPNVPFLHRLQSSAIRTHGRTTARRLKQHVCRKSWLRKIQHGHESVCFRQHRLHQSINFLCTERQSGNQTLCFSVPHTRSRPKRSQIFFFNNRNITCFPTCPLVSHGPVIICVISTLKSWSVPSCRVSCCPAPTYGVCVLQSRLFPRGDVPCPASPCHACQTTTRSISSKCHHSPDDVIWWHTATERVQVASYISSIQKSVSAIRFCHGATSTE